MKEQEIRNQIEELKKKFIAKDFNSVDSIMLHYKIDTLLAELRGIKEARKEEIEFLKGILINYGLNISSVKLRLARLQND